MQMHFQLKFLFAYLLVRISLINIIATLVIPLKQKQGRVALAFVICHTSTTTDIVYKLAWEQTLIALGEYTIDQHQFWYRCDRIV